MEIVYSLDGLRDYLRRERYGDEQLRFDPDAAPHGGTPGRAMFLDRFLENAIEVDVDAICDGEDVWIGGIMQHVEEAGIHSGDSACVLPPHSLGGEMLDEIRRGTRDIAMALNTVGLINVQYGVLGDDLYVIEANPRASRTVPFVSKATGLPLAKLACRVMLGERLADMNLPDDPAGTHVSVKEAVLPFDRFAGADALLGPEMRSTGEVMGVAADFPAAFAKAQAAAGAGLPSEGTVFLTVTDSDKAAVVGIAAQLHDLGFRIVATRGTAAAISRMGIPVDRLAKLGEGSPNVVDLHRPRRRRPRDQHPDRHRGALGRLRDPPRRRRPGHPVHHDGVGRHGGHARDRRRPRRQPPGGVASGAAPQRSVTPADGTVRRARMIAGGRTLAPIGRRLAEVTAHRRVGAYDIVSCDNPDGPDPDPGQFYMLAAAERWGGAEDERPFLPRAFSVLRRQPDGTLDFLLEDVGPGTGRLCALRPGDGLWILGPLGNGFAPARDGRRPVLAGGGVGIAPLAILSDVLGAEALVLLGFRDGPHAEGAALIPGARVATDDGSAGHQGLVTDLLRAELGRDPHAEVYACGPPPMLEAVRALCARARRTGPARAGVGHGVRVRRVLRVRGSDARRLRAAVRRRAGPRRRRVGDRARPRGGSLMAVEFCGIALAHRVINASGTFDAIAAHRAFGDALLERFPFAAYVSKTVTVEPRQGNPPPRLLEQAGGMINSIGLPNKGLRGYLAEDLPRLAELPVPLIVNVMGFGRDEVVTLVAAFAERDEVAALELNVSCPNVKTGMVMGADPAETAALVDAVRPLTSKPLIVKLTPNCTSPGAVAAAAEEHGADAHLARSTRSAGWPSTRATRTGAGSAAAPVACRARPSGTIALAQVAEVRERVRIPLVGMGGVQRASHACDLRAGRRGSGRGGHRIVPRSARRRRRRGRSGGAGGELPRKQRGSRRRRRGSKRAP